MAWTVELSAKVVKQQRKLPQMVRELLFQLARDIEAGGPVRGAWPNYSKLAPGEHHCHLKKGKPTYVAVWREHKGTVRLVEIVYAGTHEKAPY
jgi:mRNA-degrading endonuclease RelE of RelBE toxin-antitoxin system